MTKKLEFAGVSGEVNCVDIEKEFEEVYYDSKLFLLSREEFEHQEEGLNFKYKYGINVIDMREATGDDVDDTHIELLLIPSPKSMHEANYEKLSETFGWEENKEATGVELSIEQKYWDVAEYTFAVRMGIETVSGLGLDEGFDFYEAKEVREKIEGAVALYKAIDGFRGFYLDKPWNMIGTTGWDMINHAINNEKLF